MGGAVTLEICPLADNVHDLRPIVLPLAATSLWLRVTLYHTVQMVLVDPCATSLWLLLAPAGDKFEHVRYVSPTHGRIQGMTKHKTGFPQPPKRTHMHIRRKHFYLPEAFDF